jgi:hypothetical protein
MNDARSQLITASFAWVPYALVPLVYVAVTEGGPKEFWAALGLLLVVRLFFYIIETLGGVLSWWVYGKKRMIGMQLQFLRVHNFPRRKFSHDSFSAYMFRIEEDEDSPAALKALAKESTRTLELFDNLGILLGMRMHSAAEAALEAYSPKAQAPVFGASDA